MSEQLAAAMSERAAATCLPAAGHESPLSPRFLEGALVTVKEAVLLCEKLVATDSPLAPTLVSLSFSLSLLLSSRSKHTQTHIFKHVYDYIM